MKTPLRSSRWGKIDKNNKKPLRVKPEAVFLFDKFHVVEYWYKSSVRRTLKKWEVAIMNTREILEKIDAYDPNGKIDHTVKLFLSSLSLMHETTKEHLERVALLAEATAIKSGKDPKAAFFGGLLHDFGKLVLPHDLFDGREISSEEYDKIKRHSLMGFEALRELHLFSALCAGLHHNLYCKGYGVKMSDFPSDWPPMLVKKVLDISMIISICDFIDAYKTRGTRIRDGSSGELKKMLNERYSNDSMLIDAALSASDETGLYKR